MKLLFVNSLFKNFEILPEDLFSRIKLLQKIPKQKIMQIRTKFVKFSGC